MVMTKEKPETIIDQKRQEVARILGEDKVSVTEPKWLKMMQQGVIVELHIRRWRGRAALDLSDLGLPRDVEHDMYNHLMKLGSKKLLPMKEVEGRKISYVDLMDNLDSAARKWLEKFSYETHWGRFIPFTMYQDWKEGNKEYEEQYFQLRDEITNNYDDIRDRLKCEYSAMARAAYRRNKALIEKFDGNENEFVEQFTTHIMGMLPPASQIFESFGYDVDLRYIPLTSDIEQDIARADRIRQKAEVERETKDQKILALRRMNDDILQQARERKSQLIDGFITDISRQLRSQIYDAVTDVLASIKKNDKLIGKSSSQLQNLVTSLNSLNFYGDRDIEAIVEKLRVTIGTTGEDRNIDQITNVLKDVGIVTRASLLALGDRPRGARELGIPAEPKNGILRQARSTFGIGKVEMPAIQRSGRN